MKVKSLLDIQQTIGSIQVQRVINTEFELNETDAIAGETAGVLKIIDGKPTHNANNRLTKVEKKMERK
jgi:hypothetical protein